MSALVQAIALMVVVWVCWISESQALVPSNLRGERNLAFARRILLQSSVEYGGYSKGYNPMRYGGRSNYTAMDVLESLNCVGNRKNYREIYAVTAKTMTGGKEASQANVSSTTKTKGSIPVVEVDPLHQVSAADKNEPDLEESETSDDDAESKDIPPVGIGGKGGTVYDVNKLKRNLVQAMVEDYKNKLLDDLGKPSADFSAVEDKLASLVQSNAVKCTTDSNLLDGKWTFAFGSRQSASALMDPNRFNIAARRTSLTQVKPTAKVEGPFRASSRTFFLEDMDEDEDAHVLDHTQYLGGVVDKVRRYNVTRLTRTSMNLDLCYEQIYLFGKRVRDKEVQEKPVDLRILYVDNDLCVSTSNDLAVSPFHVYTKSDAWVGRSQRRKRHVRYVLGTMRRLRDSILAIVFLRRRLWSVLTTKKAPDDSAPDRILVDFDDESKRLTVLKLGDLENDAQAWEGEDDPFVHLSADERQEKLKKLRLRDIQKAADRQMRRNAKKARRAEKRKSFKKPN